MKLADIKKPTVAIVSFGGAIRIGEYFKVTLDPKMLSPTGAFIRFGVLHTGDELQGLYKAADIVIEEVLDE